MPSLSNRTQIVALAICLAGGSLSTVGGCSTAQPQAEAPPPLEVEVVDVEQKDVPIYGEWIGTLDGMVNAQIRAQVTGYLLRQMYLEGSFVKKGQRLFELDPRPFETALERAKGTLAQANAQALQAEANYGKTQLDVERYTPLAREQAISQQDLDNAVQANLAARAQVEAAKATIAAAAADVQSAELNLGFTRIQSPVDGIAGLALAQVGDLISAGANTLTTVSTVDPIKAYFTVTEQEYLKYVRDNPIEKQRQEALRDIKLELILADGSVYSKTGQFFVADREVNVQTGSIRLAGLFSNPGNILRPGQYGRVRAATDVRTGALLVPQRTVTELQGNYQVAVVGNDNKVDIRSVKVGERSGSFWIIEEGLKPGERVIAEGIQKVRPGAIVTPKPFVSTAPPPTS